MKDTTVVKSILPGGKNHQKFITGLDKVADFINSLVTAEGVKVPVIFRTLLIPSRTDGSLLPTNKT